MNGKDRWSLPYIDRLYLRIEEDRARRQQERERRRVRAGWIRIPENKTWPTIEEASAALSSPCYEVFRDADGVNWMRKIF